MESNDYQDINVIYVRKQLKKLFSLDELNSLCFNLSIEYEDLPGDNTVL